MLVHIKDIVKHAKNGKYAVGAFNAYNLESVLGIAHAAVVSKSPIIIQVSEESIKYLGLKPITHIVSTVAKNIASGVPVALHLDHGKSFDSIFECINAGFSSVHIDASHLPFDENINLTKHVVEVAHSKGVWVQGEVGAMAGTFEQTSGKKKLKNIPVANVENVVKFVEETKVDTIAAPVGTAHGVYKNEDVKIQLLKEIITKIKIPFVLHGASGLQDAKIKKAVKAGASIINTGSDIKIAFCSTLIKECKANPKETDPRNLLKPTIKAIEKIITTRLKVFGSDNRIDVRNMTT